jgi:DNA-binding LacI/PurR family transcriptional regulator
LIISDITNPFFSEIIPAIEERLGIEGFVVLVGNSSEDRKREERLLAKIREFPTRLGGYESVRKRLQIEGRPTAALCFNDAVALGVIEAIQVAGLKVGSDFGVIGFNDVSVETEPALTTIDTAPRQLDEIASELLLRRMKKPDSLIQSTILHPRMIVPESCGTI